MFLFDEELSETMRGITCSVLYLVSRALEDWMLFSWGFIAWGNFNAKFKASFMNDNIENF